MDWLEDSLCKGKHVDLWFPPSEVPKSLHSLYYDIAKLVCDQCPVRVNCERLGAEEEFGMWGGTTPNDRKRLSSYIPPKKTLTPKQLEALIPRHNSAVTLDIKPLRTGILAEASRRK